MENVTRSVAEKPAHNDRGTTYPVGHRNRITGRAELQKKPLILLPGGNLAGVCKEYDRDLYKGQIRQKTGGVASEGGGVAITVDCV